MRNLIIVLILLLTMGILISYGLSGCTKIIEPTPQSTPTIEIPPAPQSTEGVGGGINYTIINLPIGVTRITDDYASCYLYKETITCVPININILFPTPDPGGK